MDADEAALARLGYEQTLYRGLNTFTNFAFGYSGVGILVSVAALYGFALDTGGPVVIFWGFLSVFALTMLAALSLAEICSAYPSAGSVYHWSGQLVPPSYAPLMSYICGWFNFLGNTAGDAAYAYSFAFFLNAAFSVSGAGMYDSVATGWVAIAVLLAWSLLNIYRIDHVGWFNDFAAFMQTATIVVMSIALFTVPDQGNSTEVMFTEFHNGTGFRSSSYVVVIGLLFSLYAFCGYEASGHLAEETVGSAVSAPLGIIFTCLCTGLAGIVLVLALLYATTDISAAVNGATPVAVVNVFQLQCGSVWAKAFAWVLVINMFLTGISSVTVTGRITYALVRDGAFPHSAFLAHVHPTLHSPVNSIFFIFAIDAIILMLSFSPDSTVALFAILSLTTIGLQVSYAIPIFLKLYFQPADFPTGAISLNRWSGVVGAVSSLWLFASSFILFFPMEYPVTATNMNWAILVVAAFFIFGAANWFLNSQFHFTGPKRIKKKSSSANDAGMAEDTPLLTTTR